MSSRSIRICFLHVPSLIQKRHTMAEAQEACGRATRSKRQYATDADSAVKDHTNAFSCIVLPWCQSTCALSGIELARMHAVHRAFLNPEHSISQFQRCLQHSACTLLQDSQLFMRSIVLTIVTPFVNITMETVCFEVSYDFAQQ